MNKVGSIEILFSGMCKGCGKSDLNLYSFNTTNLVVTSTDGKKWFIRCAHEDACNRMLKLAKGEDNVRDKTQEDA